jgi:thioredoxin reductase (NADPH)
MTTTPLTTDIAIIGAGPVGLFTVFEAGFLGYRCAVLDSLPDIGGQLTALYPEKPIYDIPGYPSILAGELITKLAEQAAPFRPEYVLGAPVSGVEKTPAGFTLTAGDRTVQAKVVCIAGGMGVFTPRKPPLDGIDTYENKSVFYAVRNKARFAGQTLVIAGGGDSAADWTVELASAATHVHLIHRRDSFRAAEETIRRIAELQAQGKVTVHVNRQLASLTGADGQLSAVAISGMAGEQETLPADALLCFFGLAPSLGPITEWGLNLTGKKIAVTADTMQTTVPGILAVGDITDYPGKLDLILTGFAESALAMKTAQGIINPEKKFKLVYTTSKGVSGL